MAKRAILQRMPRPMNVPEDVRRFVFAGDECLYRDHLGRRVVADLEGSGDYRVERSSTSLLVFRGDEHTGKFAGSFQDGLIVLAEGSGNVVVRASQGSSPFEGPILSFDGLYEGAGWVVESFGSYEVDDRREAAPEPEEGFPTPFYRSVRGRVSIVKSGSACEQIDRFNIADAEALSLRRFAVQNISTITQLRSTFGDGSPCVASVASHLNTASWKMRVSRPVRGLILRKMYDRFHGRQRARVMVDGRFAGWWYEAEENRIHRWAVSDFGIPGELVRDGEIEIAIDPPAGSPLWSVGTMEVFAVY